MSRGAGTTEKRRHGDLYSLLARSVRTIRVMNGPSGDPTYVAAGRVHAFVSNDAHLYDVVAGALIAQEAGALVTDFAGNPWTVRDGDILVAASPLHAQLVEVLGPTLGMRASA